MSITRTSPDTLLRDFTFTSGAPVPDGMPFSTITLTHHPSNLAVFEANSISEASDLALHAFRHGKQGALWLTDNGLRFYDGDDIFEKTQRDDAVFAHMHQLKTELKTKFNSEPTDNLRQECEANFSPHLDDFLLTLSDQFRAPAVHDFRLLVFYDGIPTVVFGRNIALAYKLAEKRNDITLAEFGHAYLCPVGSALFLLNQHVGTRNALIHSFPHVKRPPTGTVRELGVFECSVC